MQVPVHSVSLDLMDFEKLQVNIHNIDNQQSTRQLWLPACWTHLLCCLNGQSAMPAGAAQTPASGV